MARKLLSTLLIASFLLLSLGGANVQASSAQKKKEQAQKELNKAQNELNKLQSQQDALLGELSQYEAQLVELLASIEAIEGDISAKESELTQIQADLKVAKDNEEKQYQDMKLRIQYMYEQGNSGVMEAMLEAGSIAEMLNQVSYYNEVYTYDRKLLTTYEQTKIEIEGLEATAEAELAELEVLENQLTAEKRTLDVAMAELEAQAKDVKSMMASAKSKVSDYKQIIAKQDEIIRKEQEAADKDDAPDPGYATNISGQDVINYALKFVGKPYVWGGTDPNKGADCSGYIQYVYAHFGIKLPRVSADQRKAGKAVSYANAQPGDIICYDGHVALYMGNGRIVHARGKEYGIVIDNNPAYKKILTIRRVL